MSQSSTASKNLVDSLPSVANSPDFEKFRGVIGALAEMFAQPLVLPMLNELLRDRVQKEYARLAAQPDWLRQHLELQGEVLLVQLLKANWEHLGGSAFVTRKFGIPRSTLHREKDAGTVIAFRPGKEDDFVFPLEQFEPGGIQGWADAVVRAVGNGAPALHFLYVPRKQLENESFAEALRTPKGRDVPALIRKTAARLAAE
jgi:hypothetical protein